jgi:hypothetical protein
VYLSNFASKFQGIPMKVDVIYDTGGDWVALYVDGYLRFQGHDIRDEDFKTLLSELGAEVNDYEEADFTGSGYTPETLEELRNG